MWGGWRPAALLPLFVFLLAGRASAGFTTYSVNAREFGERQIHGVQNALFTPGLGDSEIGSLSIQLFLGDEGPESDLPGAGVGFSFARRIMDDWSFGLGTGTQGVNVGSWWISGQFGWHWESPSGWRVSAQLAAAHQDAGGDFALLCDNGSGGYYDRYIDSLRYAHVYEHLLLSKDTGRVRWLFDIGHMGSYPTLEEGVDPFGGSNDCDQPGDDAIHRLTLGVGAGLLIGRFELGIGLHGLSAGLHFRLVR